jgi:NAD(P)-dependent dehydrogenase (short-subunit alcohol dehydrogenase family)
MFDPNFSNQNILITGASSGIGRQTAIDLSDAGAALILVGRDATKLSETANLCNAKAKVTVFARDVTDESFSADLVEVLTMPLTGVVLNAGVVKVAPIAFLKIEDIDNLFETNVKSNIILMKQLLRKKQIQEGASIVVISSISTKKATIGNALYNATKGALSSFAQSLALELAPKGIRVNTLLPGYIETNILGRERSQEEVQKHLAQYPLGRFGQPKDVANLICFLLSDSSKWITGSEIVIDGGFSIH